MNKVLSDFYELATNPKVNFSELGKSVEGCRHEMEKAAELAESVILAKMPEKDAVTTMLLVQKFVAATCSANGNTGILLAEMDGSLQAYTHTVILATIGLLMDEEVL